MMTGTFGRLRGGRFNWRRELPPVLAVAGLAADYLSPPALWTMLLPFAAVVLLIGLRRWALAATVFLLCSWVLIPTAARVTFAVEETRGEHNLFAIEGVALQSLDEPVVDPCGLTVVTMPAKHIELATLPVGPGHLINPRWIMRETFVTFAELHNQMVIEDWYQSADCIVDDGPAVDDAR